MNKESLLARVAEIEKALTELSAKHAVYTGQLAEARHWLATLELPEDEKKDEAVEVKEGEVV